MKTHPRLRIVLTVVTALLLVAVSGLLAGEDNAVSARPEDAGQSQRQKPKKPHPHAKTLLALDAESATSTPSSDSWIVTLNGVSPQIVFMDERPNRDAGLVSVNAVISQWKQLGFEDDPPNAFLSGANLSPTPIEILDQPEYPAEDSVSFQANLLGSFAEGSLPTTIDSPVLVIDEVTPPDSTLLDLTIPDVATSGTIGSNTYHITNNTGTLESGAPVNPGSCPAWLACSQTGFSVADNQGAVTIQFDQAVDINVIYLLDFYTALDGNQSRVAVNYNGGQVTLLSDDTEIFPETSGFLEQSALISQTTFLTFSSDGDFSVAGILFTGD